MTKTTSRRWRNLISTQAYIWGDASKIEDEDVELTVRVHDECNGSDVFGSDICTCRPYLTHAIEECIKTAQRGGTGVVVYFRKEGRALGEVTKYLVYNMRKRQEGGDKAKEYERGVIFNPSTPSTRPTRQVFQLHSKCCRCSGHALSSPDARRAPLARHHEDPQLY